MWSQQETGATMFDFRGQGKKLALVAMLFGISAAAQAGEGRLLYASLGDTTRAPIGWVEFCADNAAQSHGAPTQPRDIVMSQAAWRDLVKINRWDNETVKTIFVLVF